MLPLEKIRQLGNYDVSVKGDEVEIVFLTPTLGEAASNPELGDERRSVVLKGVLKGDMVEIKEAYVRDSQGNRREISLDVLTPWLEYVKSL